MQPKYCFKIQIIDRCNLNCKGCDHFASLVNKHSFQQSLSDYSRTLFRLKNNIPNNIREIILYGGEPLLHPELYHFIKLTKSIFPDIFITIQTNAILLEKFLNKYAPYCITNNIMFKITEYPPTQGIVQNIKNKFPKVNVEYTKNDEYEHIEHKAKTKLFNVKLNINNPGDKLLNRQKCYCKLFEKDSLCIRDNKIYACPISMCVNLFDEKFNTTLVDKVKYIPIENVNLEQLAILSQQPTEFCTFCTGVETDLPWEVSKKNINEWVK